MMRYIFWFGVAGFSAIGLIAAIVALLLLSLPNTEKIRGCMTTEMFKVYLCPGGPNYTPIRKISPTLIASVIISEDASFYQHHGFDFSEIKDSLDKNLKVGGYVRGGSTISQQLVKNVFLTQEKSLVRKIKEAFLTYELEKTLKKSEILERYLNVVQFGKNIFGIKAAAKYYFHKDPDALNVLESAFLTALLPNPVKYSQSFRQKKLTAFMQGRVSSISAKLLAAGRINETEYSFAKTNLRGFPWVGLGNATEQSIDFLNKIETTDFTKVQSTPSQETEPDIIEDMPASEQPTAEQEDTPFEQ